MARRAGLDRKDLDALAASDALMQISGNRRQALWQALAIDPETPLGMPQGATGDPKLTEPTEGQEILADYASTGLTLRRHPLALLRERLRKLGLKTAEEVAHSRHGQLIRAAGIVTCRQRPATASGVMFVTLEDETGYVNLVVWNDRVEKQRRELLRARLLGVVGQVQRHGDVVHILAGRFRDLTPMLGTLRTASRDFH
jgi:error-prone DNA polymerase